MEPLVSILIPAFNAERWIGDTIRSALGQTWRRREIIVVDEGSADQTPDVARQFRSKTVTVVTQLNQGAAAARNKALSLCKGDYIQWLDADDLLASDKIALQMEATARCLGKRTLLSGAWGHFIYRPSRTKFVPSELWCDLSPVEWLLRKLDQNLFMQPATWLVSRELTQAAGPWNTSLLGDDDGEYFCRVISASDGVRFVPEARVHYRRTRNSLSYIGRSNRKLDAHFESVRSHIGYLRSLEESERVGAACLKHLQRQMPFFYPERIDIVREAEKIAASLGAQLEVPRLSRKYAWTQKLFGWTAAKHSQLYYNQFKSSVSRSWDRALSQLERTGAGLAGVGTNRFHDAAD